MTMLQILTVTKMSQITFKLVH